MEQDSSWLGLQGTVVVITGAAGGVGQVLVESFLSVGAVVALLDRDEAGCEKIAQTHRDQGRTAIGIGCDIADEQSVIAAAARVAEELGPAEVLVNNAGILHAGDLLDIDIAEWNALNTVNLTGFLLCARSFGQQMKASGRGAMVHTSSIGGHMPQAHCGAYSVSKAAVRMLSQGLAIELGRFGIRSNVVSPAMLVTPLSEAFYRDPMIRKQREEMVPLGRIGTPQDIADATVWLASPRASYLNGEELVVDGGLQRNLLAMIPRPGFDGRPEPAQSA